MAAWSSDLPRAAHAIAAACRAMPVANSGQRARRTVGWSPLEPATSARRLTWFTCGSRSSRRTLATHSSQASKENRSDEKRKQKIAQPAAPARARRMGRWVAKSSVRRGRRRWARQ